MTSKADTILLIDLDGTLLKGNSFHLWVKYILGGGSGTVALPFRWYGRLTTALYIALRLARLIDHARWKLCMQKLWGVLLAHSNDAPAELDGFITGLMERIDKRLHGLIRQAQENGSPAVLCTAAAMEYAETLGRRLSLNAVVATPPAGDPGWTHNIGEMKCRRVLALLETRQWQARRRILYTDHNDDLPLMAEVDAVVVVADDEAAARKLRDLVPAGREVTLYVR